MEGIDQCKIQKIKILVSKKFLLPLKMKKKEVHLFSHQKLLQNRQNRWNDNFQDTEYQATKDSDPWEVIN